MSKETVFVNQFTDGILDHKNVMLGPVKDGGIIIANTAPGCWGPMITPEIKGGHEVTVPVKVDGAEVGDAVAIYIKSVQVTSNFTSSGVDQAIKDRFLGDPFVAAKCPNCNTVNPKTRLEGIGYHSVICEECGEEITPFRFESGYTIAFDSNRNIGLTVNKKAALRAAENARKSMAIPENSIQNPIVNFAACEMTGIISRLRPFIGQLGTTPSKAMPDSHNAGDFGAFLIDAPHEYSFSREELIKHKTDGHLDINKVREGAVLICPVKVKGGGVYVGDVHAMQGDGEIAGHTCDVSAIVTLKVKVIKNLTIDGPILLPVEEDLPFLAKPITNKERCIAMELGRKIDVDEFERSAPISFIGTGDNLNEAINNGLERAAKTLDMTIAQVRNRATINGSIEIGRAPGVITVTFLAPLYKLKKAKLYETIKWHYLI